MTNAAPVSYDLKRLRGRPDDDALRHLLKRSLFGVRREDMVRFHNRSLKRVLKQLLNDDSPQPAPPVNNYNDDKYTDPDIAPGATWITAAKFDGMNNGRRKNSFKNWWMGLIVSQQPTLREKMVMFWHNHFVTETNTVDNALFCYRYNALLRQHALGNFKALVKAVSVEPAMLRYLNGAANTKKAPDENYGRELQELFTIGKGPGSHYTEDDVKAAARVLTGYTLNYKTYTASFEPHRHDDGDKRFSNFYDNHIIHGKKDKAGEEELDDLLDMIFSKDEVSLFICRKLYRFFVYHTIDDQAETNVIRPLAALFRKKHYEIRPVLEALLGSRHFFDPTLRGGMIKSPVDFVAGLCREFDCQFPGAEDSVDRYGLWEQLRNQTAALQQNIGDPPNVAGWQAWYQAPEFDKLWISSDTLPRRNQFTDRMVNNGLNRKDRRLQIDLFAFAASIPSPDDPDKLIEGLVKSLYPLDPGPDTRQFIKTNILLSGLAGMISDHYWTNAWNAVQKDPGDKVNHDLVQNKLKLLFKYLMDSPEYQLM